MNYSLFSIWQALTQTPLLWLSMTLLCYEIAQWLYRKGKHHALLNPTLVSSVLIILLLSATHSHYDTYFKNNALIFFLLSPATVALAIPLYHHLEQLKRYWKAVIISLFIGTFTAVFSAIGIGWALGGSREVLVSLATKSVTTPIAIGIAEKIGGVPPLAVVMVIMTGLTGAVLGKRVLDLCRVQDPRAQGFGLGMASHGIGTARAFQINNLAGSFGGLAMALTGILTALIVPFLLSFF